MVRWSDPEGSGMTDKFLIRPRKIKMSDLPCGDMKATLPIGSLGTRPLRMVNLSSALPLVLVRKPIEER